MANDKKAYLVDVSLRVRVIIDDRLDPDIDPEFNQAVINKVKEIVLEDPISIAENITDWDEDEEVPYDPDQED